VPNKPRVFSVGRLDVDTTGALLLTDDGDLAHQLTHPSYGIEKEYVVWVKGQVSEATLKRLARGVELDDGMTAPCGATLEGTTEHQSRVRLVLHEGRNRQVRRMMEAVKHKVISLARVRVGPLSLEGLASGEFRPLEQKEIRALRRDVESASKGPATKPRPAETSASKPKAVGRTMRANARPAKPSATPKPASPSRPSATPTPARPSKPSKSPTRDTKPGKGPGRPPRSKRS